MSLQEHIQKLHRIAHQMIADRMQTEELIGAALDGSSATGRIWETSDIDFSIFPVHSQHEQSVEWRVYEDMLAHVHVTSKQSTDNLIENYPHSFIESAKSGNFTSDPTWFLDRLSVMSIVHDRTGHLGEVKKFVATRRFAPQVLKERLRLMMEYVDEKLAEAEKMLTNEDYDSFLRLLYNRSGYGATPGVIRCVPASGWCYGYAEVS
jgi:predicted nucleotidyltransferase